MKALRIDLGQAGMLMSVVSLGMKLGVVRGPLSLAQPWRPWGGRAGYRLIPVSLLGFVAG